MSGQNKKDNSIYGVAVDLGSTTIAMTALDSDGNQVSSTSFSNPQIKYGADVITRVKKCVDSAELLSLFKNECHQQIQTAIENELNIPYNQVAVLTISGNTIMQHFMKGLSVACFASAPFIVEHIEYHEDDRLVYPPCFSAFVGADILCGASWLQLGSNEAYDLMIDLGTNGEMLLVNQQHGFATSTACGPVFDYAIGGAKYGSDSIHAIAQCVKRRLIDQTGKIADAFFEDGIKIDTNFIIKQQNVRNFQLAKGAILSGIQCLTQKAGISEQHIQNVYISGGLGFHMEVRDCFTLNMLPQSFKNRIKICDNTSLQGAISLTKAILASKNNNFDELNKLKYEYENLRSKTTTFELSNFDSFQDIYIQSLNFS